MALRTLLPTVQPNCCSPCRSGALRACPSGSSAGKLAMRRMRSPCCARAATGHATAEQRDELAPSHVLPQAEGHTLPQPFIGTVLCITANFGRR
jgi:hypothetical protein